MTLVPEYVRFPGLRSFPWWWWWYIQDCWWWNAFDLVPSRRIRDFASATAATTTAQPVCLFRKDFFIFLQDFACGFPVPVMLRRKKSSSHAQSIKLSQTKNAIWKAEKIVWKDSIIIMTKASQSKLFNIFLFICAHFYNLYTPIIEPIMHQMVKSSFFKYIQIHLSWNLGYLHAWGTKVRTLG